MTRIRPQVMLAIATLGILSGMGIWFGMAEISAGCVGGVVALGMRVLEGKDD